MRTFLTCIAAPDSQRLTSDCVADLRQHLSACGIELHADATWLAVQEACFWTLDNVSADQAKKLRGALRPLSAEAQIDIHITTNASGPRLKKLLVADMESTIIQEELVDELAAYIGQGAVIAKITERAMRGDLDFEQSLNERVSQFAGLEAATLQTIFDTKVNLMPGAATLIATQNAHGTHCALVSGGFTVFTQQVADRLGFHENHGNELEIKDGKLTGRTVPPILDRQRKAEILRSGAAERQISTDETIAVGDGANDLDMITAAGVGVAFRAKPVLADAADVSIIHGDLTSLLYLQGIPKAQFVATL